MVCVYPKDIPDMPRVPTNKQTLHYSMTHQSESIELSMVYNPQITLTPHFSRITLAHKYMHVPCTRHLFTLYMHVPCTRPPTYLVPLAQGV